MPHGTRSLSGISCISCAGISTGQGMLHTGWHPIHTYLVPLVAGCRLQSQGYQDARYIKGDQKHTLDSEAGIEPAREKRETVFGMT